MSQLGELLVVLARAHEEVSSLQARFRDWAHPSPSNRVLLDSDGEAPPRLRWERQGPWPHPSESTRSLWLSGPERLRVEMYSEGRLTRFAVRNGSRWWRWDETEGRYSGTIASSPAPRRLPPLLDPPLLSPSRFVTWLRIQPSGVGEWAGRTVLLARAWPRAAPADAGTRSYELAFDADHGTMLRWAVIEGDHYVQLTEALEVVYNAPIDPERFVFAAPKAAAHPERNGVVPARLKRERSGGTANGSGSPTRPAPTIWLTGLSGAGKTTLARAVERVLVNLGFPCCVLDGDQLRQGLSQDLGFSREERGEQARRAAHAAALVASSGTVAIVALISPYSTDRAQARDIHARAAVPFFEVWVDTPLGICARRDPKGLYAAARAGELPGLTGVEAPYEPPQCPDLRVSGAGEDPSETGKQIARLVGAVRPAAPGPLDLQGSPHA